MSNTFKSFNEILEGGKVILIDYFHQMLFQIEQNILFGRQSCAKNNICYSIFI